MIDFDIETEALPEHEIAHLMPEFTAPSNYKDPEKIASYKAEAKAKWLEDAALSPITGRVLTIAWKTSNVSQIIEGDEQSLLNSFAFLLHSQPTEYSSLVCGWNIKGFDIPFLIKRGWKHGICFPKWLTDRPSFDKAPYVLDLAEVFKCGDYKAQMTSLDTAAKFLGFEGKLGSGKDFAKLYHSDREAALKYAIRDVKLIGQIRERIC